MAPNHLEEVLRHLTAMDFDHLARGWAGVRGRVTAVEQRRHRWTETVQRDVQVPVGTQSHTGGVIESSSEVRGPEPRSHFDDRASERVADEVLDARIKVGEVYVATCVG